jgi:hypothetical protein
MTSTISIFDEFNQPVEVLNETDRHRKRVELEKHIFSILKTTYGKRLQDFWQSCTLPIVSSNQIVIIERRIHENLEFLIQNCAWAGKDGGWSLAIVCSDVNLRFIETVLGEKKKLVHILPLFKGNPEPARGKQEYNELLQTAEFYKLFQAEVLCLVEMDCYFRKQIPDFVTTCDYIAAPYAWNQGNAGGGLSFRNRACMIDICRKLTKKQEAQDVYASQGIKELGYTMPPLLFSKEIVAESIHDADPVGVHQWWTFFNPKAEEAEETLKRFLKLDMD